MKAFLNPWMILGLLTAFLGFGAWSYQKGDSNGSERVQRVLEAGQKQAMESRVGKIVENRKIEQELQKAAETERKATHEQNVILSAQLATANRKLQQRASRPPAVGPGKLPEPARPGPGNSWATGAELYRDDGQFLVGEAYLAQLVRNQRDTCYRLYRGAQAKIKAATQ